MQRVTIRRTTVGARGICMHPTGLLDGCLGVVKTVSRAQSFNSTLRVLHLDEIDKGGALPLARQLFHHLNQIRSDQDQGGAGYGLLGRWKPLNGVASAGPIPYLIVSDRIFITFSR